MNEPTTAADMAVKQALDAEAQMTELARQAVADLEKCREARAAAEAQVAELRAKVEYELSQADETKSFEAGAAAAYNFVLSLLPAQAGDDDPYLRDARQEIARLLAGAKDTE